MVSAREDWGSLLGMLAVEALPIDHSAVLPGHAQRPLPQDLLAFVALQPDQGLLLYHPFHHLSKLIQVYVLLELAHYSLEQPPEVFRSDAPQ